MVEQKLDIEAALRTCYVQILGAQGQHMGGGVLVDKRHVVTCAHVVADALAGVSKTQDHPPKEAVSVAAPFVQDSDPIETVVQVWGPAVAGVGEADVAILRLKSDAPPPMEPRSFAVLNAIYEDRFSTLGITESYSAGRDQTGIIRMAGIGGRILLEGDASRHWPATIGGFSGSAVWDCDHDRVVGIVVSEGQAREAYLIPTQVVRQLWTDLPIELLEHTPTDAYIQDLTKLVSERSGAWSLRDPSFDIHCDLQGQFVSSEQIVDQMAQDKSPRVVIKDVSGAGKSKFIGGIIRSLLGPTSRFLPVLCDLQSWDPEDSKKLADGRGYFSKTEPSRLDVILSRSVARVDNLTSLSDMCRHRRPVILVDAVDAVGRRDQRKDVYDVLGEFEAKATSFGFLPPLVIMADRSVESAPRLWLKTQLTRVSDERCRELVDSRFDAGTFDRLLPANQTLLQYPLLLDVALSADSPRMVSFTDGIRKLFVERLGLNADQIGVLAEITFECHVRGEDDAPVGGTSVLDKEVFGAGMDTHGEVAHILLDQGVLVESSARYLKYYHQRIHDYLTAIHLATSRNNTELWNRSIFDRVTFDSGDPGVLAMTLELVGSTEGGDRFLERVYDWNWNAAMHAAIQVADLPERKCTPVMMAALLAMIKEKTFDDVLHSRARAAALLESVDAGQFQVIVEAQGLNELREAVEGLDAGTFGWSHDWRRMFLSRWEDQAPSEEDIRLIANRHSLVGWCAANVLRRGPELSPALQMAVRASYTAARTGESSSSEVTRWRAIHVLGICPGRENASLILDALDHDPYYWVKYGAARALTEIAARSQDTDLTRSVLLDVQTRCATFDAKIQLEIGRCVLTRAGTGTWRDTAEPLISLLVELNQAGPNSAEWAHLKEVFDSDEWALQNEHA